MGALKARIAILDVDGTIVKGSAGVRLAEILSNGRKDPAWDDFWEKQELFGRSGLSYNKVIETLSKAFAKGVKGKSISEVGRARMKLEAEVELVNGFLDFSRWMCENGFSAFLLSASPPESFPMMAFPCKPEGVYGLALQTSHGKYTGKCVAMTDLRKRRIVRNLLAKGDFALGIGDRPGDMDVYKGATVRVLVSEKEVEAPSENIIVAKDFRDLLLSLAPDLAAPDQFPVS